MTKTVPKPTFTISTGSIFRILASIAVALLMIHIVLQLLFYVFGVNIPDTLRGRLDIDNEISIPTWYSQLLLFIPAVLGFAHYRIRTTAYLNGARWWLAFSGLFLFLSMDEGAMLHEAFVTKIREWTTDGMATGLANHLWLIPVGIVFCLLLVPFMAFLRSLTRRTAKLLLLGIGLLAFGAIVYETFGLIVFSEIGGFWYHGFNIAVEEGLEMLGACIVTYAVLEELRTKTASTIIALRQ